MNKLKISTRLTFGFSLLLLLIIALSGVGLWSIDTAHSTPPNEMARLLFITLAVITLLTGVVFAITLTRSIVRPLNNAIQVAQTIAAHDLTLQIDVHGLVLAALGRYGAS